MVFIAFLVGWGIAASNAIVEVDGQAVCLRKEELQPQKVVESVLWGWNRPGSRSDLDLGYSVEGVPPERRDICIEAIRRWGNEGYGIRIRLSERPAGAEKTIVFLEEVFVEPTATLATADFPWTGGASSRIRINPRADWSRYDLLAVLVHEVGHALGFLHTHDEDSVMRPQYSGQQTLGWSDILRASQLYLTRPWPGRLATVR